MVLFVRALSEVMAIHNAAQDAHARRVFQRFAFARPYVAGRVAEGHAQTAFESPDFLLAATVPVVFVVGRLFQVLPQFVQLARAFRESRFQRRSVLVIVAVFDARAIIPLGLLASTLEIRVGFLLGETRREFIAVFALLAFLGLTLGRGFRCRFFLLWLLLASASRRARGFHVFVLAMLRRQTVAYLLIVERIRLRLDGENG